MRRFASLILLFVLVATACAAPTEEPFDSVAEIADASGSGSDAPAPEPDPACDPDNARPSLQPDQPLPQPGAMPAGTRMADILSDGTLRIGVAQDTLLFGFLNPGTGEIEGFDVEIGKLVANAIFGTSDGRVELIPISSAERIPGLVDGRFDIVVKTMTITCTRWGQIDFSSVYYESGQKVLVREGAGIERIEDMTAEESVCAAEGTTSIAAIDNFAVQSVGVETWTDCLVLFQQGRTDGISTDDTILAGLAAQDPFAVIVGDLFSEEPYGIGSSKSYPEFTRFINAVLEQARQDGTWQDLYDTWLRDTLGEQTPPTAQYR